MTCSISSASIRSEQTLELALNMEAGLRGREDGLKTAAFAPPLSCRKTVTSSNLRCCWLSWKWRNLTLISVPVLRNVGKLLKGRSWKSSTHRRTFPKYNWLQLLFFLFHWSPSVEPFWFHSYRWNVSCMRTLRTCPSAPSITVRLLSKTWLKKPKKFSTKAPRGRRGKKWGG